MRTLKKTCEVAFGKTARWSFRHYWLSIALVFAILLSLVLQLPHLTMDTSNEAFFRPDDKVLVDYNAFRNQFGKDEFIVITVSGSDIFNLDFLEKLRKLHQDLEKNVPYIDKITSLINVRNTRGEEDGLIVEDFLEDWPENQADLVALQQRAEKNTLYENFILNTKKNMTAIVIKPLACNPDAEELLQEEGTCQPMTNLQNQEMVARIGSILARYNATDFSLAVSGMPVVIEYLNITLGKDLQVIIPMTFVVVLLFLGLLFRRVSGIVYPMIVFAISLVSAVGIMAALRIPMSNITTILPSFILVVGISDAVHILALFYPEYQKTGNREEAIVSAMGRAGLPVLMTSLTTAGGLISFMAAKIAPIADLGVVIPAAVFLALFYTVFLLPALLALFPVKRKVGHDRRKKQLDGFFTSMARFTCNRQGIVFVIFGILFVLAVIGTGNVRFEHNALKWFPEDSKIRMDTEKIDQQMGGTVSFDVVIDTGRADGLYDPAFINALESSVEKFSRYATEDLFVGKVLALTTVLKETNRALHANKQEFYSLPKDRQLIAQELFLFQLSGSDDLDELVDQQFSKTRFTMHVPYRDTSKYKKFVSDVEADLHTRFPNCIITTTGVNALFVAILNNVMKTMARSYTIALIIISLLMVAMLGKIKMGLLSMIPNLFPIVMVIGLMGWLGIPLDLGTVLIGSISLGLVVDDTIHFFHHFGKQYDQCGDPVLATEKTLKTVGRAMLVTSLVLVGGFLCNLFSDLGVNRNTGTLLSATIFIALVTDFLLTPAILSLVYRKKQPENHSERGAL